MSFRKGELITASKLNSIGKLQEFYKWQEFDYNHTYWTTHSTGEVYIRQPNGKMVDYYFKNYSKPTGGRLEVALQKKENGIWRDKDKIKASLNGRHEGTWSSFGTGFYRVIVWGRGGASMKWYWGVRDAQKGKRLRYFSGLPRNSTYSVGTLLTTGVLNTGKVGTF